MRIPALASCGPTDVAPARGVPLDQLGGARADALELLVGGQAVGAVGLQARGGPALEAGDANHEELVEVRGEDGEELGPLERQGRLVLGQLEHPGVEVQPGELAVEESLGRQVGVENRRLGRFERLQQARGGLAL